MPSDFTSVDCSDMENGPPASIIGDLTKLLDREGQIFLHSKTTKNVGLVLLLEADLVAKLVFDGATEEEDCPVLVVELGVRVAGNEIVFVGQDLTTMLLFLHGAPFAHSSVHVEDTGVDGQDGSCLGQLAATALDHGQHPEGAARPFGLDVVVITGKDDIEPLGLVPEDVLVELLVGSLTFPVPCMNPNMPAMVAF